MGNKQRASLLFFSFDVGFFQDRKIKALKGAYGADGIAFFLYLLCEIYREGGYYTIVDDDFYDFAADELGMSTEKIGQMLNFLIKRSLFNHTLFSSDKVLTSNGVQVRYQLAKKAAGLKTPVLVDPHIWLLSSEQTESYIKFADFSDNSCKNDNYSTNNGDYSKNIDTKESKVKESKEKEREEGNTASPLFYGVNENVRLTNMQYQSLKDTYTNCGKMIDKFSLFLSNSTRVYPDHYAKLIEWAMEDNQPKRQVCIPPKEPEKGVPCPPHLRKEINALMGKMAMPKGF